MTLISVHPIGMSKSLAFVDGPCLREVDVLKYPVSVDGIALRDTRREKGITTRRAAELLGLHASEYCGLENGRFTLSLEDWTEALRKMGEAMKQ